VNDTELLKRELLELTHSLEKYTNDNRDNLSAKSRVIHDLKDIGFVKISATKWAFDIKEDGISYVSFIIVFRGRAVDITEDHIVVTDGKEVPVSSFQKPFTMMAVRYSKVVSELLARAQDLTKFFKGEIDEV